MDYLRLVAGGVLVLTFAGAVMVRGEPAAAPTEVLALSVCGQDHGDHGTSETDAHLAAMAQKAQPGHAELIATMEPMHTGMMRGLAAEDFDAAFLCSMIPHHQGAVEMARVALRYGSDPFVTMLAHEIIASQETEIGEMGRWLMRRDDAGTL